MSSSKTLGHHDRPRSQRETWQTWAILVNLQLVLPFIPIPFLYYKIFISIRTSGRCIRFTLLCLEKSKPVTPVVARERRCETVTDDKKKKKSPGQQFLRGHSNPSKLTRILWGCLAIVNKIH